MRRKAQVTFPPHAPHFTRRVLRAVFYAPLLQNMNPETTIHPQFTASIAAGLAHWQNETVENTDAVLILFDEALALLTRYPDDAWAKN
ncbi:MAG: hypothetical protein R6X34_05450 [Chloroflexota bacterium]